MRAVTAARKKTSAQTNRTTRAGPSPPGCGRTISPVSTSMAWAICA
jgi:hypothetical protein